MNDEEIYAGCTSLRLEMVDWLATLSTEEWETRSLCSDWTVREVVGHLVAGLDVPTSALVVELIRQRLRVNRANSEVARRAATRPIEVLLAQLRQNAGRRLRVPVVGVYGPLVDLLVHGGDMRLPLGHHMPSRPDLTVAALDRLVRGFPGLVPRGRLHNLSLVATDTPRTWGHGVTVEGDLNSLLMAVTGRRTSLQQISGPGAKVLAQRL